jgi:hypothetical protein
VKNAYCNNRRFGAMCSLHHQGHRNERARTTLQYLGPLFLHSVLRLLVIADVPSTTILLTLIMEDLRSSETSVLTRATKLTFKKTPFFIQTDPVSEKNVLSSI